MTSAVLTPFVRGAATQQPGGRLWRKKVLPVGDIEYKGRTLSFTRSYNDQLAAAYQSGAYDQVPFQLADHANTHTNDPERFRGDVISVDSLDDGLYIMLAPTDEGEKTLLTNPRLGVSARIVEDYARSDGKHYPAAIQHVLGTLDPRIPGLGAWEAIEASNQPETIIDLTGATFAGQEGNTDMPELTDQERQARLAKLLEVPADQWDKLVAQLTAPAAPAAGTGTGTGTTTPPATADDQLTAEELAELEAAAAELDALGLLEDEEDLAGAGAPATALSNTDRMAIEMANVQAEETARQLRVVTDELDAQRFDAEKKRLAGNGIPPYITELARPFLEGSGRTIELSNGTAVDGGQVMRKVLDEVGKLGKLMGEPGIELGSPMDAPEDQGAATAREDIVARFRTQTGAF
jgi:hypothetical protein